jgi:hypothetical protein
MKKTFDKHYEQEEFQLGDLVLKWDARNEDKGKHEKFDNLWTIHLKSIHITEIMLIFWKN